MARHESEHFRLTPRKSTFASLGSNLRQVGKVIDISLSGLTLEFLSDEKALVNTHHVDIFTLDGKYSLSGLPCSLIHQSAAPIPGVEEEAENGLVARRCGLKYEDFNSEQWRELAEFIENYTLMDPAEPLRDDDAGDQKK
ncbi:MAG: hypothetical protein V2B19_00015 [Pseudomonadota bacterium]